MISAKATLCVVEMMERYRPVPLQGNQPPFLIVLRETQAAFIKLKPSGFGPIVI
jgi:hypothetical protein